jgi:hypothetical protein
VQHFSSVTENGSTLKQDSDNDIYALGGGGGAVTWQEQVLIPNLTFFLEEIQG